MIKRFFLVFFLYSNIAFAVPECWVKDECASGNEARFVSESEQTRAENKTHDCTLTPNDQATCEVMCHAKYKTKSLTCTMNQQKQPDKATAPATKTKAAIKKKPKKKTDPDAN